MLAVHPNMPATVIAERIGSITWLRQRVRELRPEYALADRLDHRPGEVVQCDLWFPVTKVPLEFGQYGVGRCW